MTAPIYRFSGYHARTAFQAKALQSGFKGALKPGFGPRALLNPAGWGAVGGGLKVVLQQRKLRGMGIHALAVAALLRVFLSACFGARQSFVSG